MARVMAILVMLVIASSLGVVSSQNKSRHLVAQIEREQGHTRALQEEFTRLDIELQAVGALPTVEKVARGALRMDLPGKDAQFLLDVSQEGRR